MKLELLEEAATLELMQPAAGSGPVVAESMQAPTDTIPQEVVHQLAGGTATLGLGVLVERGTGFLANILAARLAGVPTFGSYSFALSTANQISTYAAGGIGATATRFSGKYTFGTSGYGTLARVLATVSGISALIAAGALWLGAAPIAHLLGRQSLTGLLRWAALSAAGMLLLECARGFFVGQRRLRALLSLSVVVGSGLLLFLPIVAQHHSAVHMVVLQGCICCAAVGLCLCFSSPLRLNNTWKGGSLPLGPMLREVWGFGLVQLSGLVFSNLAGWWLTLLVARSDTSMVQMSFFGVASQLRNLAGIAPGLLTEGSYAVMADSRTAADRTPHRVMALCTFGSLAVSLVLAALGIVFAPWGLKFLYGYAYAPAATTVAFALAIAVVHMGNAPAAARLTIVSIRTTGVINTVWAVFVAAAATLFLVFGGTAWQAMAIYLAGHLLSAVLVLFALRKWDHIPQGMIAMFAIGSASAILLPVLALERGLHPWLTLPITASIALIAGAATLLLGVLGKRYQWVPSASAVKGMGEGAWRRLWRTRSSHV